MSSASRIPCNDNHRERKDEFLNQLIRQSKKSQQVKRVPWFRLEIAKWPCLRLKEPQQKAAPKVPATRPAHYVRNT